MAHDIDAADEVIALANLQAVQEWFARREKKLVEDLVTADATTFMKAQARVEAHRELQSLVRGIEAGRAANLQRYDELRKHNA